MSVMTFELQDLRRILRESAGTAEGVDLDGDILDIEFDDLGYDSIAMMETAARISREYGIPLDDDALTLAVTPRLLLELTSSAGEGRPLSDHGGQSSDASPKRWQQ